MGLFRDWFDKSVRGGPTRMEEMMNPLLAWRLQHFVSIPADEGYLRHYFQFLNKESRREEFIVFYGETIAGFQYERTAHRKEGEDTYVLLSERGPWSIPITFLNELGKRLPANTQSPSGHHAAGVQLGRRPVTPEPAPTPPLRPQPPKPKTEAYGFSVGEHVVYPQHGVGKILAIEEQEIAGAKAEFFVINFKNDKMTLRVATASHSKVGLRRLADEI